MTTWEKAVTAVVPNLHFGVEASHLTRAILGTGNGPNDRKVLMAYIEMVFKRLDEVLGYTQELSELTHSTHLADSLKNSSAVLKKAAIAVLDAKDELDKHQSEQCMEDLIGSFKDFWNLAQPLCVAQALHFPMLLLMMVLGLYTFSAVFKRFPKKGLHAREYQSFFGPNTDLSRVLSAWLNPDLAGSARYQKQRIEVRKRHADGAQATYNANNSAVGKTVLGYEFLPPPTDQYDAIVGWLDTPPSGGSSSWSGGTSRHRISAQGFSWPPQIGQFIYLLNQQNPDLNLQDYSAWHAMTDLKINPTPAKDLSDNFGNRYSTLLRNRPRYIKQLGLVDEVVHNIRSVRDAVDATIAPMSDVT